MRHSSSRATQKLTCIVYETEPYFHLTSELLRGPTAAVPHCHLLYPDSQIGHVLFLALIFRFTGPSIGAFNVRLQVTFPDSPFLSFFASAYPFRSHSPEHCVIANAQTPGYFIES